MAQPPSHFGTSFTPTIHSSIPDNLDPTKVHLPNPFVVVVTGAGKGLGYHTSLAFAKAGCSSISISSRTSSDLDDLEAQIKKIQPSIEVLKSVCDVQDESSVVKLEAEVRQKWGRVDVVIANAGIISKYIERSGEGEEAGASNLPIGIVQDEDWNRVLDININGVWRISKAFMPLLISTKDGTQTLICSTSLAAHSTDSALCPIAYNVSKIACNRLIEHVANDHGKEGVCAYALHPGAVKTPQTENHRGSAWNDGNFDSDDQGLAGAFSVWLSREKREWVSGRYLSCTWDVEELEGMKDEIVKGDKLKFRMIV